VGPAHDTPVVAAVADAYLRFDRTVIRDAAGTHAAREFQGEQTPLNRFAEFFGISNGLKNFCDRRHGLFTKIIIPSDKIIGVARQFVLCEMRMLFVDQIFHDPGHYDSGDKPADDIDIQP